ncbi:MAG: hypothetical protein ABSF77_13925 [Spirochaetia bacterium]|jgi:hypothetical protein
MSTRVSLSAHPKYLIASDIIAFLFAALALFAVSRIPMILSPLAFAFLTACIALGFGADIGLWFLRGIRSVELADDAITFYKGRSLLMQRIERGSVTRLRIARRLGRRSAVLFLSSGSRVRITEDVFPREAFGRFLTALDQWR